MLRDYEIDSLLVIIGGFWKQHPDWSLEQLVNEAKGRGCFSFLDDWGLIQGLAEAETLRRWCGPRVR